MVDVEAHNRSITFRVKQADQAIPGTEAQDVVVSRDRISVSPVTDPVPFANVSTKQIFTGNPIALDSEQ